MAKQLKHYEWLDLFKWIENWEYTNEYEYKFASYISEKYNKDYFKENVRRRIWNKFREYQKDENVIFSKTGTAPKKGKGSGRPKKKPIETDDSMIEEMTDEQKNEFIKIMIEIFRDNKMEIDWSKIKKSSSVTNKQFIYFLGIPKSTFYKKISQLDKEVSQKTENEELHSIVKKAFYENKGRFGRWRLSIYILKVYKIDINYRTLGRIMNKLNLICVVRPKRKVREIKNTNVKIKDLVNRDYNGITNNIIATDVSYIKAPNDIDENHVYLSVAIHHKTKKILNWNLSRRNDTDLVISHIKDIKFKKPWILHSDHGFQYSSSKYLDVVAKNNGNVSMGRVGNSLDNREVEYFFSNIKSECLNFVNYKTICFDKLKNIIKDYIEWYNNERFQSVLNWKTPQQSWDALSFL
ncbi:IS3 family transposase [Mycoplasma sp. 2045]|uniref:IS3 family transposase n=1 Tax=Mycoplasma sp. 2045 TaxID=2967301 RepID=UPI00211C6980|nr:IS3 family transposase [Mycoplasma sp. 2045]UUM20180.1 IS3 family transposase [Mycoplasma sp. 2045]